MVTYIKDVDLIILSNLDVKDVLNLCSTCKYTNSLLTHDLLWKNLFLKRYGSIEKSQSKTWKYLYMTLTTYLKIKSVHPHNSNSDTELQMKQAIIDDNIDIIRYSVANGYRDFTLYLGFAAMYGTIDIIEYFYLQQPSYSLIEWCMAIAAQRGRRDIVDFFIEKSKDKNTSFWNGGLWAAGKGDQIELMKYFISQGADGMEEGLWRATRFGKLNAVKFYVEHGATNFDEGLLNAVGSGNLELVKFLVDAGATNIEAMERLTGNPEIRNYLGRMAFIQ